MATIDIFLERNRRAGEPFTRAGPPKLCLLTCDDAVLTGRLEGALGLQPNDAVVIRIPGSGAGLAVELIERLIARAVFINRCGEVLVLTHSSCAVHRTLDR